MSEHVRVEDAEGVRTITLNRPEKRNALTVEMYAAMAAAVTGADAAGVGAVLLRGAGGFFTAGNDIQDFLANPPAGEDAPVFRFLEAIATTPVALVAAVEGMAVGIGTTLLFHCDLAYAADSARLSIPFIDLGVTPEGGSSLLMPRAIGRTRAARMLMLGEPLDAAEALQAGILTGVVPAAELYDHAQAKARTLAAKPRQALRQAKALLRPDPAQVMAVVRQEAAIFARALRSPEAIAAFQAFMSKGRK